MCLYSRQEELVAMCDIPCFKVLSYEGGEYYTPFYTKRVSRMVLRGLFCLRARDKRRIVWCGNYKEIGGGYIHVYASQSDAISAISALSNPNHMVFRCVIPKGTHYWMDDSGYAYAARKIRFFNMTRREVPLPSGGGSSQTV